MRSSFGPAMPVDILQPEIDPLDYSALALPGGFPESLDDGIWLSQLKSCGAMLSRAPVVVDGNVTTSRNPASAIDVAFHLLEELTGPRNAEQTRKAMGFSSSGGAAPV